MSSGVPAIPPKNELIIIKYSTNFPAYDRVYERYLSYTNQIFSQTTKNSTFVEAVQDGYVFFFKDWATFSTIHTIPYPDFVPMCQNVAKETPNFLWTNLTTQQIDFPKEGVIFEVESSTHPIDRLYPLLHSFYTAIHPAVICTLSPSQKMAITFPTLEVFHAYLDFLFGVATITTKN